MIQFLISCRHASGLFDRRPHVGDMRQGVVDYKL